MVIFLRARERQSQCYNFGRFVFSVQNFITASFFFVTLNDVAASEHHSSRDGGVAEKSLIKWCNTDYIGYLITRTSRVKITFAWVSGGIATEHNGTIYCLVRQPMTSLNIPYAVHFLSSICNIPLIKRLSTSYSTPFFLHSEQFSLLSNYFWCGNDRKRTSCTRWCRTQSIILYRLRKREILHFKAAIKRSPTQKYSNGFESFRISLQSKLVGFFFLKVFSNVMGIRVNKRKERKIFPK